MRNIYTLPNRRAKDSKGLKLVRCDGRLVPVDISLGYMEADDACHAVVFVRDLTKHNRLEELIKHRAAHDELTGLPNRWLFRLRLNRAKMRVDRNQLRMAVLFLDLDYFKTVNDSYGHTTGDALLVEVSKRIRIAVGENNTLARMGGDEFAVILGEVSNSDEVAHVATKLLFALQESYCVKGHALHSGASVGVALYPDDAPDNDTLLRYADMALYQAKKAGRGTYAFYSNDLDSSVNECMRVHTRLKEAIARNLFELHYQPQVGVESGLMVGVEALLRWNDAELGQVSPNQFIPIAEATGLILPLSDWVLQTACKQIAIWAKNGTPLRVAVNISTQQFHQRNLPELIREALRLSDAPADLLDIEITESVAMAQPDLARQHINSLVRMGCRVALDDFGTGYSSLGYLKLLPVSKLKIDKSFMDGIPNDADDVTISRSIISLAHNLGMTLVAEGVETEAQLDFLNQNNCEIYQGWLFSKAVRAEEITEILAAYSGDRNR